MNKSILYFSLLFILSVSCTEEKISFTETRLYTPKPENLSYVNLLVAYKDSLVTYGFYSHKRLGNSYWETNHSQLSGIESVGLIYDHSYARFLIGIVKAEANEVEFLTCNNLYSVGSQTIEAPGAFLDEFSGSSEYFPWNYLSAGNAEGGLFFMNTTELTQKIRFPNPGRFLDQSLFFLLQKPSVPGDSALFQASSIHNLETGSIKKLARNPFDISQDKQGDFWILCLGELKGQTEDTLFSGHPMLIKYDKSSDAFLYPIPLPALFSLSEFKEEGFAGEINDQICLKWGNFIYRIDEATRSVIRIPSLDSRYRAFPKKGLAFSYPTEENFTWIYRLGDIDDISDSIKVYGIPKDVLIY